MEAYLEYLKQWEADEAEWKRQRERRFCPAPFFSLILQPGAEIPAQSYMYFETVENLREARGDYVLYLKKTERLSPEALYRFAEALEKEPQADLLFADEDRIRNGLRQDPFLKPDFSKKTLLSYNCIGSPLLVSRKLAEKTGGQKEPSMEASYTYALACAFSCRKAVHIPRILVSRQETAKDREDLDREKLRKQMEKHLLAAGEKAEVLYGALPGSFRVETLLKKRLPLVQIVILSRNDPEALRRLLESIEFHRGRYSITVVDAGSREPKLLRYYSLLERCKDVQLFRIPEGAGLGFAGLANFGAGKGRGEQLLFLDLYGEILSPDYLQNLISQSLRPGAGAVGGRILDSAGRILDCGRVLGLGGWTQSLYAGCNLEFPDPLQGRYTALIREVSALSGKFLMIEKQKFFRCGGFDESFSDFGAAMELCLRLRRRGFENLYTPYAELRLYPSMPQREPGEKEKQRCYDLLRPFLLEGDPFYSPHYDYAFLRPSHFAPPGSAMQLNPLGKGN